MKRIDDEKTNCRPAMAAPYFDSLSSSPAARRLKTPDSLQKFVV